MIHWVLASVVGCFFACCCWGQAGEGRSHGSLSGMVEVLGRPISGARITVWAAHPRYSVGTRCRFNYPDVGRQATTNEFGAWTIDGLDESMVYELIVASDGTSPIWVRDGDPRSDEPIDSKLLPRHQVAESDPRAVCGRVLDESGQPVAGALVVREFVRSEGQDTGPVAEADRAAITDRNGEFQLVSHKPCQSMFVSVFSKDHAKSCATISCGSPKTDIVAQRGGYITGRITKRGQPVMGIVVVARTKKAIAGFCSDSAEIATDENGRFAFPAMPPVGATLVMGLGEDTEGWRVPPREIVLGVPGAVCELGEIEMEPAWILHADVTLAPDLKLPEGAKIVLNHQESPISHVAPMSGSGAIEIRGVVPGVYQLTISGSGVELDPEMSVRIGDMTFARVTIEHDAQRLAVRLVASDESGAGSADPAQREIGGAEGAWRAPTPGGGER